MKKLIALRIEDKEDTKVKALAKKTGLNYSEQIRQIIKSYFDRNWYKKIFKNE